MRILLICVAVLSYCATPFRTHAQALYPVDISEKIANASLIVEGKVLDQHAFWNPKHTMIYTANRIEVYKTFKGSLTAATIEVMTIGGTVGTQSIDASDVLTLEKGNVGVLFCYPNSINLASPLTGNRLYDVYSSGQGSYTYDLATKTASAPFVRYASIENELYKELIKKIGHQPVINNNAFNLSSQAKPATPLAPVITSFSPQLVNAGATLDPATNLLTINGSGFGTVLGDSSAVLFDDANNGNGGAPFVVAHNSPLVQSWTDNQIQVRVPSRAGTGNFQVRDASSVTVNSPDQLIINYSVLTSEVSDAGVTVIKEINLMNDNGIGGYTILYSTGTGGGGINLNTAPEKETFQRALKTWKEGVGFNVTEGGTTTIQAVASDNANVILFDNNNTGTTPLAAGVLAICYSYSNVCLPITTNQLQKTEFDIVIRNNGVSSGSTSFTSGPCPPATSVAQTDLETVVLHELGHGLNLAHVNDSYQGSTLPNVNPGKLMNYAIVNGVSRKSTDYAAYRGALYCTTPQGNTYGTCSGLANVEMTQLARIAEPLDECPLTFPTTSTPPNTVVNFDLVHATSNKFGDPSYTRVNCAGTGTAVTNNAFYVVRSDNDGGDLNILVSGYSTYPASVQTTCTGAGIRLTVYQVNTCPAGQAFPSPIVCRTFNGNGALATITGMPANVNYLIFLDGLNNTKANFSLTFNGGALPVTLLDFKGTISNSKVSLVWKTTREINSKEFLVEKSFDGTSFNQFAVVKAKGNTTSESSYALTDDKPYSDYTFYRLKIMDKDGRFQYSGIVKVKTPKKSVVISRVYPNPTSGIINLEVIADSRKTLTVEAFNLLGKRLTNISLTVEQGITQKPVSVNALATGTYFIQVKDSEGNVIEKSTFIKH